MNFEISRVYRDIIEEVGRSLEDDMEEHGLSSGFIHEFKASWGRKLREMTSPQEPLNYHVRPISEALTSSFSLNKNSSVVYNSPYTIESSPSYESPAHENQDSQNYPYNDSSESTCVIDSDYDSDDQLEKDYPNYMMCLYVKVDKNKQKWRIRLKHGFLNIGKAEYVFDTAHGDLIWC